MTGGDETENVEKFVILPLRKAKTFLLISLFKSLKIS